ncbi:hypothetical protein CRE_30188 [Caenorhabditis remanei]|uniref:DUF7154 domain-containing protein n=1 Tax=Caenorhabditis remanei TaxID=31234 RepID=E3NGL0_CAERE|nr:hypothetical protein CRE_30188 [Caenorhabditis remanei]
MPSLPRDSLFDVIAGSEVTRNTESSREAILVYQNVGSPGEGESELPIPQSQVFSTPGAASGSSRESDTPILRSIAQVEEESEVPGSQSQDVTTSLAASGCSRESDQSTPILGSVGQVDMEPIEPTRPSAENLPRYENLENLESFRVIRQLVPVYQYVDCRGQFELNSLIKSVMFSAEEPVRFRPQPEEIPIETPCLDFTVNFVLDYWKILILGLLILGLIIFLIIFFATSKHGSVAPTFGTTTSFATVTTTVTEPMQFTISTTVASKLTSPPVDDTKRKNPVNSQYPMSSVEINIEVVPSEDSDESIFTYCRVFFFVMLAILIICIVLFVVFMSSKPAESSTISTRSKTTITTTSLPVQNCTPKTDTTFLFAYSNNLSPSVVEKGRDLIVQYFQTPKIVNFANIRFDTTTDDLIYFHSSKEEFQKSVTNNLPDSKLSFPSTNTGSDVLNVLRKFLANQESPLCGAIVYILMKRWPNTQDVSELISQLRQRHIFVYTVSDTSQSGGENQSLICEVTHGTNGFCDFQSTGYMKDDMYQSLQCISNTFQIISQSYEVTGKGVIQVPAFVRPYQNNGLEPMALVITYQNHSKERDGNLKSVGYRILDDKNENVWMNSLKSWDGNVFLDHPVLKNDVTYQIVINYEYGGVREEKIEVRVYSSSAVESWLPFSCYVYPC